MDEIKPQKDELNKDKRNSTNNKHKNDRLNMILSVIDRSVIEYKFFLGKQLNKSKLPKWVKVSKKRFHVIKNRV